MSLLDFTFAWEGASHPDGPWHQLRVVRVVANEARFDILLAQARARLDR